MARQQLSKAALTRLSWVAMIVGALLILLAVLAYPLGIAHTFAFGWRRILGVIIGVISILFGVRWRRQARESG